MSYKRIPDSTIERAAEMLIAGGTTQRVVAKVTGISTSLISQIATGKRPVPGVEPGLLVPRPARKDDRDQEKFTPPSGPLVRCPGPDCGAMTQMPCVACGARAWKRKHWPNFAQPGGNWKQL